jgi:hypothetical protein
MFIGTYNVGDILAGAKKKTGKFIFGAGSECFFYFMPSNPLHAVNKKYVDQIVSPIANQLTNMIQRYGDRIPNSHPGIPNCMYIYSTDLSTGKQAKWLIDGLGADGLGASKETEFIGFNVNFSMFWLNVKDGRYFGDTIEDQHIANMGAVRSGFLSRTVPLATSWTDIETNPAYQPGMVKDAAVLFKNSKLRFDSTSRPEWNDARDSHDKTNDELATIKNVKDLATPGGVPAVCGPYGRFICAEYNSSTHLFDFTTHILNGIFDTYFDFGERFTSTPSELYCLKDCVVSIMGAMEHQIANVDGWSAQTHLELMINSSIIKDSVFKINTQDQNQGYTIQSTINANAIIKVIAGQTIKLHYSNPENQLQGQPSGTCDICILQG